MQYDPKEFKKYPEVMSKEQLYKLQHAVMLDLLDFSPMNKVQRPKKAKYIASYYNDEELAQLFEKTKTHKLGLLIQMTAFYGFRREEIVGLR